MKLSSICLITLFLFTSLAAAKEGMNPTGEAWLKAFKAGNLEAVVALYAPDAVLFPPDAMEAVGTAAIRNNYKATFDTYNVQDVSITDAHHEIHGDLSYSWGKFHMTLAPKAGGEAVHAEGRFSDVSKKVNGKWMYIVDHASAPLAPPPAQTAPTH